MDRWSGPGKALEVHLAEYDDARRTIQSFQKWIKESEGGQREVRMPANSVPRRMHTWMRFAMTYAWWKKNDNGDWEDGLTNAAPEFLGDINSMPDDKRQRAGILGVKMMEGEYSMLGLGVTHYISEDIIDTVEYAANQAEPEPLFPTDLPTPAGFVVFERPLIISDLHPDTGLVDERFPIPIRAMGWQVSEEMGDPEGVIGPGVTLYTYTDTDSYNEVYVPACEAVMGKGTTMMTGRLLFPLDVAPWRFGRSWSINPDAWKVGETPETVGSVRRFFLALCRFMWQELLVARVHDPDRAAKRRLHRAQFPGEGYVKVLHLRRQRNILAEQRESTGDTLQYRHRVRGHWRRVYCRSLGPKRNEDGSWNQDSHRLKWIEEYWQGPEDGPTIDGYDVTAVVR